MHADGSLLTPVTDPVDAPVVGQHGRRTIAFFPCPFPELLQTRVASQRSIVQAHVALLEDGTQGAGVGPQEARSWILVAIPGGHTNTCNEYDPPGTL